MNQARYATTIRFDDDYTRSIVDTAAAALHETRTAFILNAARRAAEKTLKKRRKAQLMTERMMIPLSPVAAVDMAQTILNPPPPNEAMKALMAEYKASNIQEDYEDDFLSPESAT
jgi:uncharacterized protein (DUF1778 family)